MTFHWLSTLLVGCSFLTSYFQNFCVLYLFFNLIIFFEWYFKSYATLIIVSKTSLLPTFFYCSKAFTLCFIHRLPYMQRNQLSKWPPISLFAANLCITLICTSLIWTQYRSNNTKVWFFHRICKEGRKETNFTMD